MVPKAQAQKWRRFTEPAFKEKLWGLMFDRITRSLEKGALANRPVLGADEPIRWVAAISGWTKLKPAFEIFARIGEIYLCDAGCPEHIKIIILTNRQRRQRLHETARHAAKLIGERYSDLLLAGDAAGREALEKLILDFEIRLEIRAGDETKRPRIPWHFWVAEAALERLVANVVPSRKQVINGAIESRAVFELMEKFGNDAAKDSKMAELHRAGSKNWKRIFRELDLTGLPRTEQRY